jgi:hypothetical protein
MEEQRWACRCDDETDQEVDSATRCALGLAKAWPQEEGALSGKRNAQMNTLHS